MRDRRRELKGAAAAAGGLLLLLLMPFEVFDVIAVAGAAWFLWWMWGTPAVRIRAGAGLFPWAPVILGFAGLVIGTQTARALARPGFVMAVALLGLAVAIGAIRASASSLRVDEG